jgi:MFS family permease
MGAVGSWLMSFLIRVHGVNLKLGGLIIAGAFGLCGLVGALVVGRLSDLARRSGEGGPLWVVAAVALVNMAFGLAAVMVGELSLVVAYLCGWGATTIAYSGPANAIISQRAPDGARGLAFALFAIVSNLIGAGLGPLAAGLLSDLVAGAYGRASIRPALMALLAVQVLTAGVFALGALWSRKTAE